jgi:hypothetical protein
LGSRDEGELVTELPAEEPTEVELAWFVSMVFRDALNIKIAESTMK